MNILHMISRQPLRTILGAALAVAVPTTAIGVSSSPAFAQQDNLERAAQALRAIGTMQADFTQTDRMGRSTSGQMTLKRPGKIRFEYGTDDALLVVSNGRSLYLVDYEVDQVQRWPIRNSPLGALLDPERDIKRYGKTVPTNDPAVISIEVRDPKRPEFGHITLIFVRNPSAPGGFELTHWVALDAQNHRTTVRLRNHRYGMTVADSAFSFKDPRKSSRRPR